MRRQLQYRGATISPYRHRQRIKPRLSLSHVGVLSVSTFPIIQASSRASHNDRLMCLAANIPHRPLTWLSSKERHSTFPWSLCSDPLLQGFAACHLLSFARSSSFSSFLRFSRDIF